jgi:hypothetical protein
MPDRNGYCDEVRIEVDECDLPFARSVGDDRIGVAMGWRGVELESVLIGWARRCVVALITNRQNHKSAQ